MNLTAEERITKARSKIMRDERFTAISPILMVGSWQVVDDIPTAATNGRDVFYGRKFVNQCDDRLLRFVVLHEYFHVMLMHMTTWAKLDKDDAQLSNIAKDMVINNMLKAMDPGGQFITIWENAYCDPQYDGLDTGEVYKRLKQQAQSKPQGGGGKGDNGPKGQQFDQHQPAAGDGDGEGDGEGDGPAPLTQAEAEEVAKAVDNALRQGALIAGKTGAGMSRDIEALLEPVVPWQDVLRDWLTNTAKGGDLSTWARPARRWLGQDLYLPSRYTEAVDRIVIGIDTSGSINDEQLRRALSEVAAACEAVSPQMVDVIYWDWAVAAHESYEGERVQDIVKATKPKGGGGTDVRALFNFIDQRGLNPNAVIVFTDGYTPWPADLKHPTLWCISTKGLRAPVGETLYVPA
jgi:predicted metal-dependent peptidase